MLHFPGMKRQEVDRPEQRQSVPSEVAQTILSFGERQEMQGTYLAYVAANLRFIDQMVSPLDQITCTDLFYAFDLGTISEEKDRERKDPENPEGKAIQEAIVKQLPATPSVVMWRRLGLLQDGNAAGEGHVGLDDTDADTIYFLPQGGDMLVVSFHRHGLKGTDDELSVQFGMPKYPLPPSHVLLTIMTA